MQTGEVLDAIGGLSSQLKAYAAKLPAIVHLTVVPTGIKPKPEAIDDYEAIVSRFRNQSAGTAYKGLNEAFVESLEAFEVGKLLGSVQPLLAVLDHLERMQRDRGNHDRSGGCSADRRVSCRAAQNFAGEQTGVGWGRPRPLNPS